MFDGVGPGRTVLSVTSTSKGDRTAAGVGVGSREPEVQRLVRGVRCATRYGYRSCMVGGGKAGADRDRLLDLRGRGRSRA